ncbi:MAG: aldehyde dehydrogenase family protein [Robiginitomaculum sp.]|nr:aldehyde dehydrogenase family protein [Robiginitomaculum sp.]
MLGIENIKSTMISVTNSYDNSEIGNITTASAQDIKDVADGMDAANKAMANLTKFERAQILEGAAARVEDSLEDYASMITREAGKVITQARSEVKRCCNTLRLSAHAALSLHGETIPFDAFPSGRERMGYFTRDPLGAILAITPFNDPLNLVAHKLGPAIAVGNSVLLKPASTTPFSAMRLVDDLHKAGCPKIGIKVMHGTPDVFEHVLALPFRMVTLTGGMRAAEAIIRAGGVKKYAMDLGGNASVIVMNDADLTEAIPGCVSGAFWAQGQNCVGVQRILIHRDIFDEFESGFLEGTRKLVVGDPLLSITDIGPMISKREAKRAEDWVNEAVAVGATLLAGGQREGAVFTPAVLKNISKSSKVWCQEVFAPIVSLVPFDTFDQAIDLANDSEVSLHMGIYTSNLDLALQASKRLEAGGVMINETSDYRFDGMPFGGYKKGSMGREGIKFSIEEMSQPKTVCFSR